ncbi:MAG: S8 family serine peptidase [Lachnospiraceae bacterium]
MNNKKTKKMKSSLALLLAAVLLMSAALPTDAAPKKSKNSKDTTEEQQVVKQIVAEEVENITRLDENAAGLQEQKNVSAYADTDVVTVIVEMDEEPVMDYYSTETAVSENSDITSGEAVSLFLASEDAQEKSEELISEQSKVASNIKKLKKNMDRKNARSNDEVEVVAQWSYITNAMAVRVPYGLIDQIRELDGVRRAYVQHVYDCPEPQENTIDLEQKNYTFSLDMVGVRDVWEKGYTGKGLLVAVLDTGIDVIQDKTNGKVLGSHESFSDDSFMNFSEENLRYTEESMTEFLAVHNLYANTGITSGDHITYDNNALYKNLKVPFGYNYADWNVHTRPSDNFHGVHVSGTVAGYAETEEGEIIFSGVAPDAQILAMKVFSEQGGGAEEVAIVSALEDSMALGADIINLSLGSDNGFAEDNTMQNEIYARVEKSGVVLMTSAGNSDHSNDANNYDGEAFIENPDNSMMSSPAIYASNLSVASIENEIQVNSYLNCRIDGGEAEEVFFTDTTGLMKGNYADQEYPVYLVDGVGSYGDYYNAGFDNGWNGGKTGIALVKRGEISFVEKINNALSFSGINSRGERYGVIAVIVYDADAESDELINMSVDGTTLDSCFISGRNGAVMAKALKEGKRVTIQTSKTDKTQESESACQMSSFSSWGAGPALELKPEITAPGGNVWSSIVESNAASDSSYVGTYEMMSGTSMAAPHMSGIGALIRQRVTSGDEFKNVPSDQIGDVVSQLLVSTAVPQKDPNGVYYSPRLQGAGLVSASAAAETPVYISKDGRNVGKLELGDDPKQKGIYKIDFTLHNISDKDITYDVSMVLLRPETGSVTTVWGERDVMETSDVVIKNLDLGKVKVKAGKEKKFNEIISLSLKEKKELKTLFPNGTYVEGFVILKDQKGIQPDLSVPMLSFFGDWTKAPIFDSATWLDAENFEYQETTWSPSVVGSQVKSDGEVIGYYNLAQNVFAPADNPQTIFHEENITISPDGNGYFDAIDDVILYQLRNARVIVFEAKDAKTGEVYFRDFSSYLPKSVYSDDYGFVVPWSMVYAPVWEGTDLEGNPLPSGTECTYTITAFGDGDYSMFGETFDDYYQMYVTDYGQVVPGERKKVPLFDGRKMDMEGDVISFNVTIDTQAPKLENNAVSIFEENGRTYISGTVYDADGSLASLEIDPIVKRSYKEGYGDPSYSEYGRDSLNPFLCETVYDAGTKTLEFKADVTEYEHKNTSYAGENYYYDFTWEGNVMLMCGDYGANERTYMISVDATSGIVLSQTSALLYPGDVFELSVNDNTGVEGTVLRTSSNPEVATIDEYGMVTAVAPGQAVITVSKGNDSAVCIVAVQEKKTEVIDFRLSIDNVEGLKPDGQAQVRVVDLYPADVEIQEVRWEVSEDEDYANDYAAGLISVEKNSSDALSGNLYLTAQQSNELLPAGHATLTVTINGVSRSMDVNWTDIYTERNQDDLVSDELFGDQVIYVNMGESAEIGAKYRQSSMHEVGDVLTDINGLKLDGADFFMRGGKYTAKLVNEEGYALPEEIKVFIKYSYGYEYEMLFGNTGTSGYYYYDSSTGEISIGSAPVGNTSLHIVAEGVVSEGNPAGEMSGNTYAKPDALYGPFDWDLKEGSGDLETFIYQDYYGASYEKARYTPSEPGVSYITVTTKDDTMSQEFAVVCLPIQADTLTLDTHSVELSAGSKQAVRAKLSPTPTLAKDQELIWTSFDEDVAVIDETGEITGVSEGYAFIKVESKANTKVFSYVIVHVTAD